MTSTPLRNGLRTPQSLSLMLHALALLLLLLLGAAWVSAARAAESQPAGPALKSARSWGYQLQNLKVAQLKSSPHDVLVIDYSRDGSDDEALSPADLASLKRKPDGSRRVVLAYLSIGEAENYRYYWKWYWGGTWFTDLFGWLFAPSWRGPVNPEWRGNYAVRYWDPDWQAVILGRDGRSGYLGRIVKAGFDGVWLDKVDSSIEPIAKGRATAKDDMRRFVGRIAQAGRAATAGFLVLPQNGEDLLDDAAYRGVIDGIGSEDLLFGEERDGKANRPASIARRRELLRRVVADGKPVLSVEYLKDAGRIAEARRIHAEAGFVPHFADRDLGRLRRVDVPARRVRD